MSTLKVSAINNPSASSGGLAFSAAGNVTGGGLDLVVPSSIAYSGGSASVSGGAVTFSGVSSVSLNGCFSSTYTNYRMVVSGISTDSTTTRTLQMRLRASGTDNTGATDYVSTQLFAYGVSTAGGQGNTASAWNLGDISSTTVVGSLILDILNPQATQFTAINGQGVWYQNNVSSYVGRTFGSVHTQATAYDGMTLFVASGSLSALAIRVYGYRN